MTVTEIHEALRGAVSSAALDQFGIELGLAQIVAETPPNAELGDVAFPVAFELAKKIKQASGIKKNPRELAEGVAAAVEVLEPVARVGIAGAGYINVFFDRARFLRGNAHVEPLPKLRLSNSPGATKVCVEHTSVNPNKAAHIGHVRNSVLGDTFQRILSATGKSVEVQNYIDNTGVQVADVVVGFMFMQHMTLQAIKQLDTELTATGLRFDRYCWDLYAQVGPAYQRDPELNQKRAEVLHEIEAGDNETASLADYVATRNVECLLETMDRLSIRYDLLPRESEILHLHFWNKAFETMKELGVIHYEESGNHAGCWVMPFESHSGTEDHETDKILVRSNGTITYTGKDIAYQMWKLGILGLDFNYRPFYTYENGKQVWMTSTQTQDETATPSFGGGETIYNVIDSRQAYPQDIVRKGVAAIAPELGEKASVHLSYEMVALSPSAAEELGFALGDEDRKRPFIEMSGRKGLGVKADDLIDRLEANALAEVESRHPDSTSEEKREIARKLAVGALRYFLLKFTRNTVIVFDFKEALSFDGETGCFCQYSAVRANSIFRKLAENDSVEACRARVADAGHAEIDSILSSECGADIWSIILLSGRLDEAVESAAAAKEPAILAKYTFTLAKAFNLFYHNHRILIEPHDLKRAVLIVAADMARRSLTAALGTLGIEVPEKM